MKLHYTKKEKYDSPGAKADRAMVPGGTGRVHPLQKKLMAKKMSDRYPKTLSREGQISLREKRTSKHGKDIYGRDLI